MALTKIPTHMLFSGAASEDLSIDSDTLFIDSSANRVGIANNSPSVALDVTGALTVSGAITGTLATAAQTNITSLGTLTGLTVNGATTTNALKGGSTNFDIYQTTSDGSDNRRTRIGGGGDVSQSRGAFIELHGNEHSTPADLILNAGDVSGGDILLKTDNTTRIFVKDDGKVGIGTSSPSRQLTVSSSGQTDVAIIAGTSASAQLQFGDSGDDNIGQIEYNNSENSMSFFTNATERLFITNAGLVGIGSAPTNLTSETVTITTPASGGGQGIAFKRLDSNSDQQVGQIRFSNNSTDNLAYIRCITDGDNTSSRLEFHTNTASGTNANLVIKKDGKVGIGTSSPDDKLDIMGGAYDQIRIGSNKTDNTAKQCGIVSTMYTNNSVSLFQGYFANGANTLYYGSADGAHRGINTHIFYVNAGYNATTSHTEAMRITSTGKVYINRTSHYITAADQLAVSGRIAATSEGSSSGAFNRGTDTGTIVSFLYNGSGKGSITTDGSNVAYNTSSDARLKNVLGDAKGLDIVNQLNPVNFEWKETGDIQDGLIAQEVEPLIPEAVSINEETDFYEMDYGKLVTPLIKAVQEQQEQIEELKAKIATLESS